ncbi:MAG: protein YgfX [Bacteroidota bacterium]
MQLPITIGLHRSRFLDGLIAVGALLASLAILFFPQQPSIRASLLLVIWLIAAAAWRQLVPKIRCIRLERDGAISLARPGDHEFNEAFALPGATVHPWLTVIRLQFAQGDHSTALVLACDSLDRADFRRLRVFLRWRADFSGAGDDA